MNSITIEKQQELFEVLKTRFEKNIHRHPKLKWSSVQQKLSSNTQKLSSIYEMEATGGEPDVIGYDAKQDLYSFVDCSPETPKGRRSYCYDQKALESRKEHKPKNSATNVAKQMGIEILDEEQYKMLQSIEPFDLKTSSWLKTPKDQRDKGGAIFGDRRYDRVFIYHNGAESYYAGRGFRGIVKI